MFGIIELMLLVFAAPIAHAPVDVEWATGKELRTQALQSNTGRWLDAPLRPLLVQLSEQRRIPLFIDRRVDPTTSITLTAKNLTWDQLLDEIGRPIGCGFCELDGIYYFGPVATAMSLQTNQTKLKDWLKTNRKDAEVKWLSPVKLNWQRLAQPRQMIEVAMQSVAVTGYQLESIPFDLWPAAELNQCPLYLKFALLTVGFEKWITVSKSGSKVKIVPYPKNDAMTFALRNVEDSAAAVKELRIKHPDLQFDRKGKLDLVISGASSDVHAAIESAVSFQKANRAKDGISTFSGELKGSRGSIVAGLAQQMDLEFVMGAGVSDELNEHIEFKVKDATFEEILVQALEGTTIRYRQSGSQLELFK